jgi:hypothetical protein
LSKTLITLTLKIIDKLALPYKILLELYEETRGHNLLQAHA